MSNVTPSQLNMYAKNAGFTGYGLNEIVAISQAEDTSGNPFATNTIGNSAGVDRGLLQINSFYHPEVSTACADDPQCAFNAAFKISGGGTDFSQWSTFTNGSYLKFLNSSTLPTTNTISSPLSSINLQSIGISSLFVLGGVAVVIMGLVLTMDIKRLPI